MGAGVGEHMGLELVTRLRQVHPAPFMETQGHPQLLDFGPQRRIVRVVPVASVDRVRPHKHGFEPQVVYHTAGLVYGPVNIVRWDHSGAEHPPGATSAKVGQPIVVRPGNSGGQARVQIVAPQGEQATAGKQHGTVNALLVHGHHLRGAVPVASLGSRVDVHLLGHDRPDGVGIAAVLRRKGVPRHVHRQVAGMPAQPCGGAVFVGWVYVPLPQVSGFYEVHI